MIGLLAFAALQVVQPAPIDTTAVQSQITAAKAAADAAKVAADAAKAKADAVQAAMPVASTSLPPMEAVTPTVGTPGTYRPADAATPRISRSGVFTVAGTQGMIGGTWATPLPSGFPSYPMFFTAIGTAGTAGVKCKVMSSTAAAWSAQCQQDLLSILAIGSGVAVPAPAGTQVYALALPSTQ